VEYASAEAVRRGGGPRSKLDDGTGPRKGSFRGGGTDHGDRERKNSHVGGERKEPRVEDIVTKVNDPRRTRSGSDKDGYKGVKGRSKPGAALAMAKRESAAIVASQGQKITF